MGSPVSEFSTSMEAMRTSARSNTYHNPMAISQILPALHHKSYLSVKSKTCQNEDGMDSVISPPCGQLKWLQIDLDIYPTCAFPTDSLVLEPLEPEVVLPSDSSGPVTVMLKVVMSSGEAFDYQVDVPKGSTLLEALEILKGANENFTWVHIMLLCEF